MNATPPMTERAALLAACRAKKALDTNSRLYKIKFIHAVRKGHTVEGTAKRFGLSIWTVREHAKKFGIKFQDARRVQGNGLPFGVREKDLDELGADEHVRMEEQQ